MMLAVAATIASFVIVFVEVKEWSDVSGVNIGQIVFKQIR